VWPLSLLLNVLRFRFLQGVIVGLLAWKRSFFKGDFVRFVPKFK